MFHTCPGLRGTVYDVILQTWPGLRDSMYDDAPAPFIFRTFFIYYSYDVKYAQSSQRTSLLTFPNISEEVANLDLPILWVRKLSGKGLKEEAPEMTSYSGIGECVHSFYSENISLLSPSWHSLSSHTSQGLVPGAPLKHVFFFRICLF